MESRLFPNDEIFKGLRSCAEQFSGIAINDPANGVSTSYNQLIRNIVDTRKRIQDALPTSLFDDRGILIDNSIWVGLQAPLSEDFIVGCLAILSLGGAIMPIAVGILPEEVNHFLEQTNCVLLLVPSGESGAASQIHQHRRQTCGSQRQLHTVTIICGHRDQCVDTTEHLRIDESVKIPSTRPGLIVFTSGTTGPPKGAVLPRHCLYPDEMRTSANRRVNLSDRMAHWIGGVICTLPPLLTGHAIEIIKPGSPAEDYWGLLKQQRITKVVWGPMLLSKLKQYYDDNLKDLPRDEIEPYMRGVRAIREIRIGSAMPTATLLQFWEGLMDVPLVMGYAATEAGGLISTLPKIDPAIVRNLPLTVHCFFGIDSRLL
jgi:malonyl-CoA/methylmalonyl-CoA synthetase